MKVLSVICLLVCISGGSAFADGTTTEAIDRDVWLAVARTVDEADIEGMTAIYHPDAVLVGSNGTVLLSEQLVKWGQDMEDAQQEGASASVSFRFTHRNDGEKTAFETGMFKYTVMAPSGEESFYIPFEAVLVNQDGKWLILVERQLAAATEADWAALE